VALCAPAPASVETYANVFTILGDGRLYVANSTVAPLAKVGRVPQQQGAPTNTSAQYLYFRIGVDNPYSPTNLNGYTEGTFVNNSGVLDWQNVKFNNIINSGHAVFGFIPNNPSFSGWINAIYFGNDNLPAASSSIILRIQDVGSIDPPGKSRCTPADRG